MRFLTEEIPHPPKEKRVTVKMLPPDEEFDNLCRNELKRREEAERQRLKDKIKQEVLAEIAEEERKIRVEEYNKRDYKNWTIIGEGYNLSFFGGPKWTFQCKKCGAAWKERLIVGVNEPTIFCKCCGNKQKFYGLGWD